MPALSQSLTFTQNSTSTVLLSYPNTGTTALTYISDRIKGDGYYNGSGGFHTVQLQISDFVGKFSIEGSLASNPTSTDWFTVELGLPNNQSIDTSGLISDANITSIQYSTATTLVKTYNFIGNLVWVRAKISEFTEGTVNSIKYNH
jgi:hypothetical protein